MKRMTCLLLCLALVGLASVAQAYEAFRGPTELLYHDAKKAQKGVNMWSAGLDKKGRGVNYIVDMDGYVVNTIYTEGNTGYLQMTHEGYLLINGQNPAAAAADTHGVLSAGGARGVVELMKWNGKTLVNLHVYSADYRQHHEVRRIWNKKLGQYTFLMLVWERLGAEDAVALGADPAYEHGYGEGWSPDAIWELTDQGVMVWRWAFQDHLVQNYDPSKTEPFTDVCGRQNPGATYGDPADYPGKLNLNYKTDEGGIAEDWNHCNSIDYNPESGHIVVNSRNWNEFYVIDHDGTFVSTTDWSKNIAAASTEAGDFLWRWGAPHNYGHGVAPGYNSNGDVQIWKAHNVQWIGLGCDYDGWEAAFGTIPGHGNILIYDNGSANPITKQSKIFEINPYDANGDYLWQENGGYTIKGGGMFGAPYKTSNMIVWSFQATNPQCFYSAFISSCQRMPNGNTVIDAGGMGHFFEVTKAGEVVWEYVNPVLATGIFEQRTDKDFYYVFRMYRVPAKHPGLKGKKITGTVTITGKTAGSSSSGGSSGGSDGGGGSGGGSGGGGGGGGY